MNVPASISPKLNALPTTLTGAVLTVALFARRGHHGVGGARQ
ncbi:hypothetical protein ACRAWD_05795 [Caulobacter segnis]